MKTRMLSLLAFMVAFATFAQTSTNNLTGLLQKGLFDEEANRDLNAAISDYQTLATDFDKDRELAATAIFRLGECYRKLGRTNDAVVQYQRIVRDFSDQPMLVNLSRQNLAGLSAPETPAAAQPNTANPELVRQLNWVKKLHTMPLKDVLQIAPTVLTDATLISLIYQYNQTDLDLIRLRTDHGPDHPDVKKAQAMQAALQEKIEERLDGMSRALSMELGASATASGGGSGSQQSAVTDDEQSQIREIQSMIQNSPDLINAPNAEGKIPLQLAAAKGQLVVAKYLLDHGADVDGRSQSSAPTPLAEAADKGHKAMVELLLSRGADVNGKGGYLNPLYQAVFRGFKEVVDVLLANKADVNARANGECPLIAAVTQRRTSLVPVLLEHGADVNSTNSSGDTPLHLAAAFDNVEAAKILLDAKANIEARASNGNTPLAAAAQNGMAKAVALLLDSGASVDATNNQNKTPLLLAASGPPGMNFRWESYADVARVLLEHHADPNHQDAKGWTPMMAVIQGNHPSVDFVRELLEHKADPNQLGAGAIPLGAAINRNSADEVELLLQHGADPNGPPGAAESPLNEAIDRGGDHRIVELLLEKGADPNARNRDGLVPLMRTSDPEITRELVAHKANVNARGTTKETPLMCYMYDPKFPERSGILLAAGANPDLQNANGDTALHIAVRQIFTNAVEVLLENHANPNIQNDAGNTPLDLARELNTPLRPGQGRQFSPSHPPTQESLNFMIAMLTQAGGLANLPKRDRIEVRRGSSSYEMDAFFKGTNDWNRFSLLETIAAAYGLLGDQTAGEWQATLNPKSQSFNSSLRFPDLKNVIIYRRAGNSTKQTAINVDVESILNSGDCSRDVWLQWGDVVEILETDHPVEEQWPGLSDAITDALSKCLARQVTVKIKGEGTTIKLAPEYAPARFPGDAMRTLVCASFMVRSVLDNSKLIRVSSDLAHVKVTRHDPQTGKTKEWTVDCNDSKDDNLWLRDGDVIEVPER